MRHENRIRNLIRQFSNRCYHCQNPCQVLAIERDRHPSRDHLVPKVRGGTTHESNIVLACKGCNEIKADMTAAEFHHFLTTGVLHQDYIAWLTVRTARIAKARGITIPRVDVAPIRKETVPP